MRKATKDEVRRLDQLRREYLLAKHTAGKLGEIVEEALLKVKVDCDAPSYAYLDHNGQWCNQEGRPLEPEVIGEFDLVPRNNHAPAEPEPVEL